jgi:HlyD family secretion protein
MSENKNFFYKILQTLKRYKYFLIIIFLVATGYFTYINFFSSNSSNTETYTVIRKDLQETVSFTGRVQPAASAELSFEKAGVVKNIYVKVGEVVKQGDPIAKLNNENDLAKVSEAAANLSAQRYLLQDQTTGDRAETVDNKKTGVEKATNDFLQAYKNAGDTLKNLSISGNTFVRDNLSSSFTGNLQNGYTINITSCDSIAENKLNQLRSEAEIALSKIENLSSQYPNFSNDQTKQENILLEVKTIHFVKITEYLDSLKNLFSLSCLGSNSSLEASRTTISTARTNWTTLGNELSQKINLTQSASSTLAQANNDLTISKTGVKNEKISQQSANVKSAQARLEQAQAEANKNILRAPFNGVITNIDLKLGELVTPGVGNKNISIISTSNFEIESKVSEVDVAKLSTSSKGLVYFDSFGSDKKFEVVVSNISPAGIISDGVPTFKTIFTFLESNENIRSGMTANIEVTTKNLTQVLSVPSKYILNEAGIKKIKVKNANNNSISLTEVTTGAIGKNGEVEIVSGISEGDVIIYKK